VKAHFENIAGPRDAIELFGVDGHYGGVAPIEDGRWNVAFSVPRRRIRAARGDMDAMFEQIIRENGVLRKRFARAQRVSGWLASPLPRFAISRSWPTRVIPLGNAAAAIEPVGGEGMGLAMRSAELAAQMLITGGVDLNELRRAFRRIWRMRSVSCRATAKVVSNPALSRWIAPSLRRAKPITRAMMKLMGK
jgi:2-polyprenyl-6-methoxyphenol hydroxylase-like FAD-dependent oxidoreductase